MNPWRIALVVGWTLLFLAGLMVLSVLVSLFYQDGNVWSSLAAVCITAASGSLLAWFARAKGRGEVSQREAIAIVVLAWLCTAFFGSLPFYFSGEFPSWLDSLFESMSGVTTT